MRWNSDESLLMDAPRPSPAAGWTKEKASGPGPPIYRPDRRLARQISHGRLVEMAFAAQPLW